jgi:hypothetical protein
MLPKLQGAKLLLVMRIQIPTAPENRTASGRGPNVSIAGSFFCIHSIATYTFTSPFSFIPSIQPPKMGLSSFGAVGPTVVRRSCLKFTDRASGRLDSALALASRDLGLLSVRQRVVEAESIQLSDGCLCLLKRFSKIEARSASKSLMR